MTLNVVARELPSKTDLARSGSARNEKSERSSRFEKLGIEVETLTPEVAEQLEIKADHGVAITRVQPDSLADSAGLSQGMVITQVNRKPVKTAEEFQKALAEKPLSKGLLLLVQTGEGSRYIVLRGND